MTTQLKNLIDAQRQRIQQLRDNAADLSSAVADQVWDKFEIEIEETTADQYMFDFAASTQMALSSMLAVSFDAAFERHVLSFFEQIEKELSDASTGKLAFDSAQINLSGLRKSLKLRRHADDLIGQAIERAKPGLLGLLFLSSDPCSDAWDREHRDNARRLRSHLLDLRAAIVEAIRKETSTVVRAALLEYAHMLDTLPLNVDADQTNAATL